MEPPIVWTPSPERVASATITRYREWLNETRGLALEDYADLWQWSVDELEDFWASIWEFFEVEASEPYERVLTSREMPGADWFPGARLSYAEHVFRGRDDQDVAIRHASELRPLGEWTWGELRARAGAVAGALKEAGVVQGDRVAAYLPNIPETIAAFLGCASIGATWSSCAPEFGVRSVVDRFAQIEHRLDHPAGPRLLTSAANRTPRRSSGRHARTGAGALAVETRRAPSRIRRDAGS